MKYCIDTSSLMDAWVRWYPPDIFSGVWDRLDALVADGALVSSEEVMREIERKEDSLYLWAKKHQDMFLPLTQGVQETTQQILEQFPTQVDSRPGKSFADPFVVATGLVTGTSVVTGEKATGSASRPKIPDVCAHFGVPCIGLTDLFAAEGWHF